MASRFIEVRPVHLDADGYSRSLEGDAIDTWGVYRCPTGGLPMHKADKASLREGVALASKISHGATIYYDSPDGTSPRIFPDHASIIAATSLDESKPNAFRFKDSYKPAGFLCHDCGQFKPFNLDGRGGTGYGTDRDMNLFCYPCGAKRVRADLIKYGKGMLYLVGDDSAPNGAGNKLTDWTGELVIKCPRASVGRHNMAGKRYDVRFRFNREDWAGVQYGDNTQICHVRRLKNTLRPIEAVAPSYWASYLINGDDSGLEPAEIAIADKFVRESRYGVSPSSCEDSGFRSTHDATRLGVLAAECQTYTSLVSFAK